MVLALWQKLPAEIMQKSLHVVTWKCHLWKHPAFFSFLPSSLEPTQLSLITCYQCMRKVGLWGFQQIESSMTDLEASFGLTSSPIPGVEGRPEHFPLVPESPRRMMTRSQDATVSPGSEQVLASQGANVTAGWKLVVGFTSNPVRKTILSRFPSQMEN